MLRYGWIAGLALAIFALAPSGAALAWDGQADRLVADLAYETLTPAAKAKVDQIIAQAGPIGAPGCRLDSMADAARLAECLHGDKADFMRGVVYDPIAVCVQASAKPPCADGRCASQALDRAIAKLKVLLADPAGDAGERAVALETIVYLVAELHQPLHVADNGDRQGARVRVTLPGSRDRRLNLYSVWDEDFVAEAVGSEETGLPYLRPLAQLNADAWRAGDAAAWIADTHRVAVTDAYGRLPVKPPCGKAPSEPEALDPAYVDAAVRVVRSQLAKAGLRLAAVLNATLG